MTFEADESKSAGVGGGRPRAAVKAGGQRALQMAVSSYLSRPKTLVTFHFLSLPCYCMTSSTVQARDTETRNNANLYLGGTDVTEAPAGRTRCMSHDGICLRRETGAEPLRLPGEGHVTLKGASSAWIRRA